MRVIAAPCIEQFQVRVLGAKQGSWSNKSKYCGHHDDVGFFFYRGRLLRRICCLFEWGCVHAGLFSRIDRPADASWTTCMEGSVDLCAETSTKARELCLSETRSCSDASTDRTCVKSFEYNLSWCGSLIQIYFRTLRIMHQGLYPRATFALCPAGRG